ncbi:MAG: NrdH-redoxin [Chloroflexi bacterium]|nr:NrdH-redoxin [Chloroflexota bacterium]
MESSNLFSLKPSVIVVYSAAWCPDSKRAINFLNAQRIEYENVDIDETPQAADFVKRLNNGKRVVPTIVLPNGDLLVEPSDAQLAEKFGA